MKFNNEVILVRHMEDKDSLLKEGLDSSLVVGQEKEAEKIAEEIYANAEKNKSDILLFITSPQKRANETAKMVDLIIRGKNSKIKTLITIDDNLRTIDQGGFVLPDGYKDGDSFEGLVIAKKIFNEEKFNSDPNLDNFKYRFGDPVKLSDGGYKYPELVEYFYEPGESYRDFLVRIYGEIITYSEKINRYGGKVKPVLFTHNLVSFIFRDLKELSDKINSQNLNFETGEVARLCFDIYKSGKNYEKDMDKEYGRVDFIDADNILIPQVANLLKKEIDFLKKL